MALDNVMSHFSTMLEPITSASFLSSLSIIHAKIYNLTIAKWLIVYHMLMKSRLLGTSLPIDDPRSKKLVFGPILAHETSIFRLQNDA